MTLINQPQGRAAEYAERALNIYKGCGHGCLYCYGKRRLSPTQKVEYDTDPNPKKNFIANLRKEAAKLPPDTPEICLSFLGDVYQPAEQKLGLTKGALEILVENNLAFTILTKGGTRAYWDFHLLIKGRARFGTSLVFLDEDMAAHWEPGADTIEGRINAIVTAKSYDIPTWISLEPVIDPAQALSVIKYLHPIVDHWKIGKINYWPGIDVDWVAFREEATELLNRVGADYMFKKSLREL